MTDTGLPTWEEALKTAVDLLNCDRPRHQQPSTWRETATVAESWVAVARAIDSRDRTVTFAGADASVDARICHHGTIVVTADGHRWKHTTSRTSCDDPEPIEPTGLDFTNYRPDGTTRPGPS